jgi:alkylation response protein AidB-like acyl-CoA dehydrogenase
METSMQMTAVRPTRELSDATIDGKPTAGAAQRLLAAVRDLTPMLAARTEEMERSRWIPQDIIDAMRPSGLYRMLVPLSHGGPGLGVPDALPVLEVLSAVDASVGGGVKHSSCADHPHPASSIPLRRGLWQGS